MRKTIVPPFLILATILVLVYLAGMYWWIKHGYSGGAKPSSVYENSLSDGITFSRPGYPSFIQSTSGISRQEPWGRWTNANTGQTRLIFKEDLPDDFVLELTAHSYGPNADAPTQILIGKQVRELLIARDKPSVYRITFDGLIHERVIEIRPPYPIAPNQINPQITDGRKLGLGLVELKIISQ